MQISCDHERLSCGGPGMFMLGRAEDLMDQLTAQYGGKVQLIYLDPPFGTGDTFHVRMDHGKKPVNLPAFKDDRPPDDYLDWMRLILTGCHMLLSPSGAIYLHIDYRMNAKLRLLMDEIFGERSFMNEIVWCYRSGGRSTKYFPRKHDTILFYRRSPKNYFNISAVGRPRGPERRNHMKRFVTDDGRVGYSIRAGGRLYKYYEDTPVYPSDVWTDIEHLQQKDSERVGYATQKPEKLLERIILASSKPGDLVMDLFSGSGTTAAVAGRLGREFIVTDASPFALYTLRARMLQRARHLSMNEKPIPMCLRYPPQSEVGELEYNLCKDADAWKLTVTSAGFGSSHPLIYAAIGQLDGHGAFVPTLSNCRPSLPLTFTVGKLPRPVLQIVDALGHQAFFALEESAQA